MLSNHYLLNFVRDLVSYDEKQPDNLIQLDFHAAYEPSFKPSMAAKY